jgi:predicted ribonuclease YlaK
MRQHPRTPVILVTRDINLQNKAEYAGLPFVEPPDPARRTT